MSTERVNQFDGEHQLAYLDKHLNITRAASGVWKKRRFRALDGKMKFRRVYETVNKPVAINYFTIREWHYILNSVAENYLIKTHLIAFADRPLETFLVKIVENEYTDE